ncbi:hypothetical protein OSTOST_06912 [Ostertagia ostertagi]
MFGNRGTSAKFFWRLPNGVMSNRDNALVVKKKSTSTFLLIIKKRWVVGNFFSADVPAVGAVVAVDWECFTGMFYTTGCVIHCGIPLENPAVFNNLIGVVEDKGKGTAKRLYRWFPQHSHRYIECGRSRNAVGKLKATVTFVGEPDGYRWTLCTVDEYHKTGSEEAPDQPLPYRGVVGAIKKGYTNAVNFITSRHFPKDVRFFTGTNVNPELLDALLGCEVYFDACKDQRIEQSSCVVGPVIPITTYNLNTSRDGNFFKLDVIVEHIGCTDEHGNNIVWSDRLEFVVDSDGRFGDLAYGLYRVNAVRHYKQYEFTKWRVMKVRQLIKPFEEGGIRAGRSVRESPSSTKQCVKQREADGDGVRNHTAANGPTKKFDISPKTCDNLQDSVAVNVSEGKACSVGKPLASSTHYREEVLTREKENSEDAGLWAKHIALQLGLFLPSSLK